MSTCIFIFKKSFIGQSFQKVLILVTRTAFAQWLNHIGNAAVLITPVFVWTASNDLKYSYKYMNSADFESSAVFL